MERIRGPVVCLMNGREPRFDVASVMPRSACRPWSERPGHRECHGRRDEQTSRPQLRDDGRAHRSDPRRPVRAVRVVRLSFPRPGDSINSWQNSALCE